MDTARIRRELRGSVRLLWTGERWLWGGAVAVLLGFGLWVGATGAALNYGVEFAGRSVSVVSWSPTTTVAFVTAFVLWVVAPAGIVTYLIDRSLRNVSGNVHTHYRVKHPFVLVAPVLLLFAIGAGAAVAVGDVPASLAGVLVAAGLLTLVRTTAYSYRVFSLSIPQLLHFSLFVSLAVTAGALLTGVATVGGRRALVTDTAAGVADLLGRPTIADAATGSTTAGPVTVPTLLGAGAALPAALAVGYVLVQSLVGLANRARSPDVPRSRLRTGQRYPEFARPTTEASAGDAPSRSTPDPPSDAPPSSGTADTATVSDNPDQSNETAVDEASDTLRHTKVFTTPDDDVDESPAVGDTATPASAGRAGNEETAVVGSADGDVPGGEGYCCSTCTETFGLETEFAYCPTCGTELEPQSGLSERE